MSNSEDYLDGLLNSISEKKSNVNKALAEDEESIKAKIADMSSLDPNDDFMDATGISNFKAEKMSHNNLREAFSESDFLKEFEDELYSDSADDFIREFEQEIDDEEERFQRGEETPEDAGTKFVQSLMDEEENFDTDDTSGYEDAYDSEESGDIKDADDSEETGDIGDAGELADVGDIDNLDDVGASAGDLDSSEDQLLMDSFVTIDESDLDDDYEKKESSTGGDSSDIASEDSIEIPDSLDEPELEADDEPETETFEEPEPEPEASEDTVDDAEELLSAIGGDLSDVIPDKDEVDDSEDSEDEDDAKESLNEQVENDESIQNILDEVENIVGDGEGSEESGESGEEESILPKEYQNDEHDVADALEINEEGVSLVDENADLDALLQGEEGMSDIGDLLDADENDIELDESREEFEASADRAESASVESVEEGKEKVGFFKKLLSIFKKKNKEDPDEAAKELLNVAGNDGVEDTTEENKKILEEMDEEEAAALEKKQKKAEEKAEKKAAKKAAKEEKKKAKEAAKAEKAKVEKKPGALKTFLLDDKQKKIPLKVIIIFVLLVVTIVVSVKVLSNLYFNQQTISSANAAYAAGDYIEAYNLFSSIKAPTESEQESLDKARLLADLQNKKQEYDLFMEKKDYQNALDALIVAVGRYNENKDKAKELGVNAEYNGIESMIVGQLQDQFGMTDEEATKLYEVKGRTKYTVALDDKLNSLGMNNSGSSN